MSEQVNTATTTAPILKNTYPDEKKVIGVSKNKRDRKKRFSKIRTILKKRDS